MKARIQSDMKAALRNGEKLRLSVLRMLLAAIQHREIYERRELDKAEVLQIVDKQVKQRCEAATLFADAGRVDLEQQENSEMEVLQAYLPEALSESECTALVDDVISAMDATSMKEMGKVMAEIQTRAQRRSDMAALSALVKARLSG
jgi:uncharacterized protein YqeY